MAETEGDLPDSCFAYVPVDGPKSDRKLRLCSLETGEPDVAIVGAAAAAVSTKGYRGNRVQLPSGAMAGAKDKIRAAWRKVNPNKSDDEMPPGIHLSEDTKSSASYLWFAEQAPTGFLVALWLDPGTAAKLALPGGEPADALHITLASCGDAARIDDLTQAYAISAVANAVQYWTLTGGTVSGYGRFTGDGDDPQDVFYASVDIPGLEDLQDRIEDSLTGSGVPPSSEHGFVPHITLQYLAPDAANPVDTVPSIDLAFSGVTVMTGTKRIDIPFVRTPSETMPMTMSEDTLDAPLGIEPARPLLFSFDQEWIAFLPKPGNYAFGNGDLDLTNERYQRMVKNFGDRVYKQDLPINIEHDSRAAGAVGWIKDMRLAPDGSIEVRPEWNETGRALIDGDRFRYASAEFAPRWQDPVTREWHNDVALGLGICTRPHFKTDVLRPLAASEDAALALMRATYERGDPVAISTGQPAKGDQEMPDKETTVTAAQPSSGTLQEVLLLNQQKTKLETQVTTLSERIRLTEQERDAAIAERDEERRQRLEDWARAEVLGLSADNDLRWFGDPEVNVRMLIDAVTKSGGDRNAEFVRWMVDDRRSTARVAKAAKDGIFSPISVGTGDGIGDPTTTLRQLAEAKRRANPSLTEAQAFTETINEHADLYVRTLQR